MTNSSMRPKHQRLTEIECAQIHALRNLKFTYQQIANELNISKGRVQYSLTKRNFSSGNQRGRKPYLSDEQVDEIEAFVCSSRETRRISYLELASTRFAEWGATENQIRNSLQRRGYARRIARRKPPLTEDLKKDRKQWAEDHKLWSAEDWSCVLWTDETYIKGGEHTQTYITRKVGSSFIFLHFSLIIRLRLEKLTMIHVSSIKTPQEMA